LSIKHIQDGESLVVIYIDRNQNFYRTGIDELGGKAVDFNGSITMALTPVMVGKRRTTGIVVLFKNRGLVR
jgi:hypothetical protein